MRITRGDGLVIGLIASFTAAVFAARDSSVASLPVGAVWGLLLGGVFCICVRLLTLPTARQMASLRERVAELEGRVGGPDPPRP